MEKKIIKIFNGIIIVIAWVLGFYGFMSVVRALPDILNSIFNTKAFSNTYTLSFFFCLFILGYVVFLIDSKFEIKAKKD